MTAPEASGPSAPVTPVAARPTINTGPHEAAEPTGFLALLVGAVGIVYGDIGTSPLYAVRECFHPERGVAATHENVTGILSLFFWALTLVVTIKYLVFIMLADNHGEGGTLALLSLVIGRTKNAKRLIAAGLFGAALLLSEGMLTPAISVLSAVEGVAVIAPHLDHYIVPASCAILLGLFLNQARGTGRLGAAFGPIMCVWFLAIAAAGLPWIVAHPQILAAINPVHAARYLGEHGVQGLWTLGSVVLCITGAEALYADMGHFGRKPIRSAWLVLVFPALLINYFGQGALLLTDPESGKNPFFELVPTMLMVPMVVLATLATIIASQALISGAFSLTQQAMQLGFLPRMAVVHTSEKTKGQIYVPGVNYMLMVACLLLVLSFGSSSALAGAYGMAVTGTMSITSVLFFAVAKGWWGPLRAGLLTGGFLVIDLTFLSANFAKLEHGGWVPLAIAVTAFAFMTTWKKGRAALALYMREAAQPFAEFMVQLREAKPLRVPGTAVFMTSSAAEAPPVLLHHFRHNRVLHEQVVILSVVTEDIPRVKRSNLVEVTPLEEGFFRVIAHYGFTQTPRVTEILRQCERRGLHTDPGDTSFYLGREKLVLTAKRGMSRWRKGLFSFMSQNSRSATDFFRIPPDRVVEIGMQVEL